ncbi:hypothetical protein [Paenibacillus radicis (ex Gao et al. 2016)]|uniref:Uncharacterized protein n=1 Tax=Paenibacillus radicis (ex Gao et al. 2016) TaxID=1737354 RepID=A0A917GZR3_9BACL|nr:hypothetical protein [Paenibacillus radicis (ex Gao et al. 2016)]GGG62856.1 hypothetical protein GCM10010918_15850 [Paenibacillus radicis (ex Gao et al. 2016)]
MAGGLEKKAHTKESFLVIVVLIVSLLSFWLLYKLVIYKWFERSHMTLEWYAIVVALLPFLILALGFIVFNYRKAAIRATKIELAFLIVWISIIPFPSAALLFENEKDTRYTYNRWVSEVESREMMLPDLLKQRDLIGIDRMKVVDLLGAPHDPYDYQEGEKFIYWMGVERETEDSVFRKQLVILFDEKNKSRDYEVNVVERPKPSPPA